MIDLLAPSEPGPFSDGTLAPHSLVRMKEFSRNFGRSFLPRPTRPNPARGASHVQRRQQGRCVFFSYVHIFKINMIAPRTRSICLPSPSLRRKQTRAKALPPPPPLPPVNNTVAARFMVRRRGFRLSLLQPSSPNSGRAGTPTRAGGGQENPVPSLPAHGNGGGGSGAGAGGGVGDDCGNGDGTWGFSGRGAGGGLATAGASTVAREISLEMSPCVPVHARCGFVIEREGVRGVGRQ